MTNIKGVINIGAHYAEQYDEWVRAGAKNFLLIESVAKNFMELNNRFFDKPNVKLLNMALGNRTGKITMYVDPKHLSFSASIFKPTEHLKDYPDIEFSDKEEVDIDKLDNIDYDRTLYDHIYITAQGAELEILKGATESLKYIKTIKSQVYRKRLYDGCFITEELTDYLSGIGFELVKIEPRGISWDHAYYQRK